MAELKPCPFCGNKRLEVFVDNAVYSLTGEEEEKTNFRVACYCGVRTKLYSTRAEAVKVWNRRTDDAC